MEKSSEEKLMEEHFKEMERLDKEREIVKLSWKSNLIAFIPGVEVLFSWLEDNHDDWYPEGVVYIYDVDEKRSGYPNYQHVRIKEDPDKLLYIKQKEDIEEVGVDHYCVWQHVGMGEDDYSGFLLLPMTDGRYFKVSYSC